MLTVIPFHKGDYHLAKQLSSWILELGGAQNHRCLVVHMKDQPTAGVTDVLQQAFGKVMTLALNDQDPEKWPQSPNLCFRRAAVQIEATTKESFLFVEPDCVPLAPTWLDQIEAEYKAKCVPCAKMPDHSIRPKGGKAILGVRVDFVEGVIPHCSGVSVYAGNIPSLAPLLIRSNAVAFDVNASRETLPLLAETDLIIHEWKAPSFDSPASLDRLGRKAVLYHQSKDGSLLRLLRAQRNGGPEAFAPAVKIVHGGVALVPSLSEAERITGAAPDVTLASEAVEVPLNPLPTPEQEARRMCEILRDLASVSAEQSKMVRQLIVDHGLGELKVFPRKARNNRVKPKKGPKEKVDLAKFATENSELTSGLSPRNQK